MSDLFYFGEMNNADNDVNNDRDPHLKPQIGDNNNGNPPQSGDNASKLSVIAMSTMMMKPTSK